MCLTIQFLGAKCARSHVFQELSIPICQPIWLCRGPVIPAMLANLGALSVEFTYQHAGNHQLDLGKSSRQPFSSPSAPSLPAYPAMCPGSILHCHQSSSCNAGGGHCAWSLGTGTPCLTSRRLTSSSRQQTLLSEISLSRSIVNMVHHAPTLVASDMNRW